jgi:hypothetical protein
MFIIHFRLLFISQVAQLSEYIPLQFPIEKVLSILDLSTDVELEYASMVITRDYTHLEADESRLTSTLIQNQQLSDNEMNAASPVPITRNVYAIPRNL